MKIIAIRHAQTALNQQGILQGRSDQPIEYRLVDTVELDINLHVIEALSPTAIWCSPLKRTTQTAELYGYSKQDVIIDNRVIEFDFGVYEGKPKRELLAEHGTQWNQRFETINIGEGYASVHERLESFIQHVTNTCQGCVLLFAHGLVLRYLKARSLRLDTNLINSIQIQSNQLHILHF